MAKRINTWDWDSRSWYEDPETGEVKEGRPPRDESSNPSKPPEPPLYVHPVERLYELRPHEFGPLLWRQLHARPTEINGDLSRERQWLQEFGDAIPCQTCQHHYRSYLDSHRPDLSSVRSYFIWGYNLHNYTNRSLGKSPFPWDKSWDLKIN